MSRPLRVEYPGAFYHVTACGNEGKAIFKAEVQDFDFVLGNGSSHGFQAQRFDDGKAPEAQASFLGRLNEQDLHHAFLSCAGT